VQVSGLSPGLPQRSQEAEAAAYTMAMGIIAGSGGASADRTRCGHAGHRFGPLIRLVVFGLLHAGAARRLTCTDAGA
jgi:hypothetical protein